MTTEARALELGRTVATPGAISAITENDVTALEYLSRHARGDWGDLDPEDTATNDAAVEHGERILSAYILPDGQKVWIITEWDRSITTLLLPSEY